MHRIYDVTSARIFRLAEEDGTERIGMTATGTSLSLGWQNPHLTPWLYIEKPTDNIQDFDFCAREPSRITHGARVPIAADYLVEKSRIGYWGKGNDLAGIRIHSRQNKIEAYFSGAEPLDPTTLPPYIQAVGEHRSWSGSREPDAAAGCIPSRPAVADGSLTGLIGTSLRVLDGSDPGDSSLQPDRTTVQIDPVTRVIESAWIG